MVDNIEQTHAEEGKRSRYRYRVPCASIVIASQGPGEADTIETRFGEIRSRSGANLKYTANDAERIHHLFKRENDCLPEDFHKLLIDPTLKQLANTIKNVSAKILADHGDNVGIDLVFAGHGEPPYGNLVLKDGILTPTQFLELQADDVGVKGQGERTIGVWLDSCYSSAFLIHLAIEAYEHGFRLDEGLAPAFPMKSVSKRTY